MKPEDIKGTMYATEYVDTCKCGKSCTVFTQRNHYAEYDTLVYVLCDCGELVEFILPVN